MTWKTIRMDQGGKGLTKSVYSVVLLGTHAPVVPPSPFLHRSKAFTGKKEDSLGRTQCYQEGEHVSCATGAETPDMPQPAEEDILSGRAEAEYKAKGTRAKAFKSWFGDWEADPANASKVVDSKTGEPKEEHGTAKMVHHGTRGKFTEFSEGKVGTGGGLAVGKGYYFAENREIAEAYAGIGAKKNPGKVITAYLNVRNPFDFDEEYSQEDVDKLLALAKEMDKRFDEKWFLSERNAEGSTMKGSDVWEDLKSSVGTVDPNDVLEKAGFDGLTHLAAGMSGAPPLRGGRKPTWGRVWVAFQPNQVKSVGNRGTFDPAERDFTKSLPSSCPVCGGKAVSFEGGWACGSPPCEWSILAADPREAIGVKSIEEIEKTLTWEEAEQDGNGHGRFLCSCGNVMRQCRCKHGPGNPKRTYHITDRRCKECSVGVKKLDKREVKKKVQELWDSFSEEEKEGLEVWYALGPPLRFIIDKMDWYEGGPGPVGSGDRMIALAEKLTGEKRSESKDAIVKVQNEGGHPVNGTEGWIHVKVLVNYQVKSEGQPCEQGEAASRTGCIPLSEAPSIASRSESSSGEQPGKQTTSEKVFQAILALRPSEILKMILAGAVKVRNPRRTAREVRQKAVERFKKLHERYGTAGACAIAGAYAGYYAVAAMNPIMFAVPVPLTLTIMSSAEALRYGWRKISGRKSLPEDWLDAVQEFVAESAQDCGEEVPELDWEVMEMVAEHLYGLAGQGPTMPQVDGLNKALNGLHVKGLEEGKPCTPGHTEIRDRCIPANPQVSDSPLSEESNQEDASNWTMYGSDSGPYLSRVPSSSFTPDEREKLEQVLTDWIDPSVASSLTEYSRGPMKKGSLGELIQRAASLGHMKQVMWRGESFDSLESVRRKYEIGSALTLDSFKAVATKRNDAEIYSGSSERLPVLLMIQSEEGVPGVHTDEGAGIMPKGLSLVVDSITKDKKHIVVHLITKKGNSPFVSNKAMSAFSDSSGGALVKPPLQPRKDDPKSSQYLFVYGTLKQGHQYHGFLAGEDFVGLVSTLPGYSLSEHGSFPALGQGHASVRGELYKVDPDRMSRLEGWEDHYSLKPVKLRGFDKPALAFFWKKSFSPGQELHPKETLYVPAGVGTVKEVFAERGDRLRVLRTWANGAVEVERNDGEKFTFFPGQFQEFGKGLDYQTKGEGQPCAPGQSASRTGCIPKSGGTAPSARRSSQGQAAGGQQAISMQGGGQAPQPSQDLEQQAQQAVQEMLRVLEQVAAPNVDNVKDQLIGKLKQKHGEQAKTILNAIVLSTPVPKPDSQPATVALALTVTEVWKEFHGAEGGIPQPAKGASWWHVKGMEPPSVQPSQAPSVAKQPKPVKSPEPPSNEVQHPRPEKAPSAEKPKPAPKPQQAQHAPTPPPAQQPKPVQQAPQPKAPDPVPVQREPAQPKPEASQQAAPKASKPTDVVTPKIPSVQASSAPSISKVKQPAAPATSPGSASEEWAGGEQGGQPEELGATDQTEDPGTPDTPVQHGEGYDKAKRSVDDLKEGKQTGGRVESVIGYLQQLTPDQMMVLGLDHLDETFPRLPQALKDRLTNAVRERQQQANQQSEPEERSEEDEMEEEQERERDETDLAPEQDLDDIILAPEERLESVKEGLEKIQQGEGVDPGSVGQLVSGMSKLSVAQLESLKEEASQHQLSPEAREQLSQAIRAKWEIDAQEEAEADAKLKTTRTPVETELSPANKKLAETPVKSVEKIEGPEKGGGHALLVTLEDGTQGVFKGGRLRDLEWGGSQMASEVVASRIADSLGLGDIVPATVFRRAEGDEFGGEEIGSFQRYEPNARSAETAMSEGDADIAYGGKDFGRAAAFDYLIGSADRHGKNWLVKPDGKISLIDNSIAFPDGGPGIGMQSYILREAHRDGVQVPEEVSSWKWEPIEKIMAQAGFGREEIDFAHERFDDLVRVSGDGQSFKEIDRVDKRFNRNLPPVEEKAPNQKTVEEKDKAVEQARVMFSNPGNVSVERIQDIGESLMVMSEEELVDLGIELGIEESEETDGVNERIMRHALTEAID